MTASLWWLALPVLLVPVWLHRQKREQVRADLLATAAFLPAADPHQRRVWRWQEVVLLFVRCLLLLAVIAWLADVLVPWRKDTVLVVQGTEARWLQQQLTAAGMSSAARIDLPDRHALEWFAQHEREWTAGARIAIAGPAAMPAQRPRFRHNVMLLTQPGAETASPAAMVRHVAVYSPRGAQWQRFFDAASDGQVRYAIDAQPSAQPELVVWDRTDPPPANMRAPLWWFTFASAMPVPETPPAKGAPYNGAARAQRPASAPLTARTPGGSPDAHLAEAPDIHAAAQVPVSAAHDTPLGRAWLVAGDAVADPARAQSLLEAWQHLHYGPQPYTAPIETLAASVRPSAPAQQENGPLRQMLFTLMAALFAAERILAHVSRRS